jgi:hypothetical protein
VSDDAPEVERLKLASAASVRAGAARAALGGYVPVGHPGHPSTWSEARQDALATAEEDLISTTTELRLANAAYLNRRG